MAWKKLAFADEAIVVSGTLEQGDVLYYDGTNWVKLAPGTAGQLLSTGGSAANPSWVDASGTTDEKVKADSSDPTAGYLSDKVDGTTIEEDATNHKIQVKDGGITVAKLNINSNLEMNYHELLHPVVETGSSLPATGLEAAGQLFYDTGDGHLYIYTA